MGTVLIASLFAEKEWGEPDLIVCFGLTKVVCH